MIKIICEQCGEEKMVYPYQINKGQGRFCSHKCQHLSMKGQTAWNKGTKGICKSNSGSFEKGHISLRKGKKLPQFSGKNNPNWKGGQTITKLGYIYIYLPEHPFAIKTGYIFKHRLIVEKYLNRYLTKDEQVHHINTIKNDNSPENLYLFSSNSAHQTFENLKNKPQLVSNLLTDSV